MSSILPALAAGNLRRNLRRSAITLLTVAISLAVILWAQGVMAGRNRDMIESVTSAYTGHVQLFAREYLDEHLTEHTFIAPLDRVRAALPADAAVTARLHLPSLLRHRGRAASVLLEGIDPSTEPRLSRVATQMVSGAFLTTDGADADRCETPRLLLGARLADRLRLRVGDDVSVHSQSLSGALESLTLRVAGVFDTHSDVFDQGVAFTTLPCAAQLGGLFGVHEIAIHLPSESESLAVRARLQAALADAPQPLAATTWRDVVPELARLIVFHDALVVLVSVILYALLALGVINTLLTNLYQRTRELGLMLALGATPWQVRAVVLLEGLILAALASLLGVALGVAVILVQRRTGFDLRPLVGDRSGLGSFSFSLVVHPTIEPWSLGRAVLTTITVVTVASFLPAWRASRLTATTAMRDV